MRRQVLMVVAILAALLGLAPGTGAAPAGAAAGDPPTTIDLPVTRAASVAVDHGTGRIFVLGREGVAVRDAAGGAVATLAVTGSEIAAANDRVLVIDGAAATMTRIDATTLATTTWSLAPRSRMSGLFVIGSTAYTTALVAGGGDRALVQVDLTTGVATDRIGGLELGPHVLTGDGTTVVAIETGALETSTATVIEPGLEVAVVLATAEVPLERVRDAHVDFLGTLYVAGGDAVLTYRERDLDPIGSLAVDGHVPTIGVDGGLVATVAQQGTGTATIMFVGEPAGASILSGLGVPAASRGLAFSADQRLLYVVATVDAGEPRLQILDLAPEVTSVAPRTIGSDGARLTIRGRGLGEVTVRVRGEALTPVAQTAGEVRLVGGDLCCLLGPTAMAVDTPYGVRSRPVPVVRVAILSPYTDAYDLADGLYEDVVGRPATVSERVTVDDALFVDDDPGPLFADLSRTAAARGPRPAIQWLYHAALGRHPDRDGLEYWTDAVARGRTLSWVSRAMAASPEFRVRYDGATDAAFVDQVYGNVLGRGPDAAGQAYWEGEMRRGLSRARVVLLVSQSAEHQARRAHTVDVTLLHVWMLDRAPSEFELSDATRRLRLGTTLAEIATEIFRSNEYAATHAP
ncbi:MAG TPA: DUF4214 domain-containing protein [Iamia sp.]